MTGSGVGVKLCIGAIDIVGILISSFGNCDLCFLKSESQIASMIRDHPELAQWWIDAEDRTGKNFERRRPLKQFANFVNAQQDWIFNNESYLCQKDGGECTG